MLNHNDLKKGILFIYNNQPYEVLEYSLNFKGRGHSTAQTKIKNLITGGVISQNFKGGDTFEETAIENKEFVFVYKHRDKFVFCEVNNKSKRIELSKEQIGSGCDFLKTNQEVVGIKFNNEIINIVLPIKICLKVIEAPPAVKGDRAEAGTKQVRLETGAIISAPLFIQEGDVVEVNTQTNEYVRRV